MGRGTFGALVVAAAALASKTTRANEQCPATFTDNQGAIAAMYYSVLEPSIKNGCNQCIMEKSQSLGLFPASVTGGDQADAVTSQWGCNELSLAVTRNVCLDECVNEIGLAFYLGTDKESKLPAKFLECANEQAKKANCNDNNCKQTLAAKNCDDTLPNGCGLKLNPVQRGPCPECLKQYETQRTFMDFLDTCFTECHAQCVPTPGDGIVGGSEQCDDGNLVSGDGCSASMTIEKGFACTGSPSVCTAVCGDGFRLDRFEACDDGNTNNGDGCSSTCTIEHGWNCTTEGVSPSKCATTCGDNIVAGNEQCDLGFQKNGNGTHDACSKSCTINPGFHDSNGTLITKCGDGITAGVETCDIGHATSPGCKDCQLDRRYTCSTEGCTPICGDGQLVEGEECDDGNTNNGDGCSSTCKYEANSADNLRWQCTPGQLCYEICATAITRKSWNDMSRDERETFTAALVEVQRTQVYAILVGVHYESQNDQLAHQTCAFLVWHAYYLAIYGNALRASLGSRTACVAVPYLDYITDIGAQQSGACNSISGCSLATRDLGGPRGRPTTSSMPGTGAIRGNGVSGHAIPDSTNGCFQSSGFGGPIGYQVRGNWDNTRLITECGMGSTAGVLTMPNYNGAVTALQTRCHNMGHVALGGAMVSLASPMDPIFFFHHGFIQVMHMAMVLCQVGHNPSQQERFQIYTGCGQARADGGILMDVWEPRSNRFVHITQHSVMGRYAADMPAHYAAWVGSTDNGQGSHVYQMSFMVSMVLQSGIVTCANPSVFLEDDAAVQHHATVKHSIENDEDIVDHVITASELLLEEEEKMGRALEAHEARSLLVENYDKRHNIPRHYATEIHKYRHTAHYVNWYNRTSMGVRAAIRRNPQTSGMKYDDECRYVSDQVELIECLYNEENYGNLDYSDAFIHNFRPAVKKARCRYLVDEYNAGKHHCVYQDWRSTCDKYMRRAQHNNHWTPDEDMY